MMNYNYWCGCNGLNLDFFALGIGAVSSGFYIGYISLRLRSGQSPSRFKRPLLFLLDVWEVPFAHLNIIFMRTKSIFVFD